MGDAPTPGRAPFINGSRLRIGVLLGLLGRMVGLAGNAFVAGRAGAAVTGAGGAGWGVDAEGGIAVGGATAAPVDWMRATPTGSSCSAL